MLASGNLQNFDSNTSRRSAAVTGMSSFFTLPASQKKRKRAQPADKANGASKRAQRDDDSISGSDLSDDDAPAQQEDVSGSDDEDEDFQDEDPAAKRIRLAEQYLANTQKEVLDDVGFDAAEVDQENLRRRMGERLQEDTAETKGKLYRWMADGLDWRRADRSALKFHGQNRSWTGVDVHAHYVYAATASMEIVKWEIPDGEQDIPGKRPRKTPKVVARTKGNRKDKRGQHHDKAILCLAVSPDGKFIATGGLDKKLIIWDAALKPLKVFTHHRDAVTALAFRRGSNQLFSASRDRTVKIWSLDELAYVETLFGHQDSVIDVGALTQEKCITVGSRDRTARLWKVVEESQLVFRGGGAPHRPKNLDSLKAAYEDDSAIGMDDDSDPSQYHEGSIDRIALIDDDTFITASDNGSLSLWNIHKKKPVFVYPLAHGLDPPIPLAQSSADVEPDEQTFHEKSRGGKQPRWITAMKSIPFSDMFITGSWDGYVRAWKLSGDKRKIEPLGAVGNFAKSPTTVDALLESEGLSADAMSNSALAALKDGINSEEATSKHPDPEIKGIVNDIAIVDRGERGKDGVLIAAAVGKEHRLGRWREFDEGTNRVLVLQVPRKSSTNGLNEEREDNMEENGDGDDFAGFD